MMLRVWFAWRFPKFSFVEATEYHIFIVQMVLGIVLWDSLALSITLYLYLDNRTGY